jgi:hypothetical protein
MLMSLPDAATASPRLVAPKIGRGAVLFAAGRNQRTEDCQDCTPIPRLIERLNRQLKGSANYFGYARKAFVKIDWPLGYRLANHLKHHRSQRRYQLPEGVTYYQHFQKLGLQFLRPQPPR